MIQRLHTGPRMSHAVVHGRIVYFAGQVADKVEIQVIAAQR